MARLFWFRRDLRLQDNVALNLAIGAAIADGDSAVLPFYGVNPEQFEALSGIRQHSLTESLNSLNQSLQNNLVVRKGVLAETVTAAAKQAGAKVVHATRAFDPTGIAEQNSVGLALQAAGIFLQLDDSYYAVAPGSINKKDGTPYRVYTPFFNAWFDHGWPAPVKLTKGVNWLAAKADGTPKPTKPAPFKVIAGEDFALRTFERFKKRALFNYHELRDRADRSGTSHLSHALAHGEIHPRTLLQQLADSPGHNTFRKEIAWREFYADVLWHNPHTLTEYYEPRFKAMRYDTGKSAQQKLEAWQQGRTGYPMVDAGMRQLLTTGWMHNRVRMIVASFLIKDLHLEWQQGARWFEENLSDYDPASNSHGWQWTAGCGTDASPYYRIFNPVLQGQKFDPEGEYIKKYIPELRHLPAESVHEPWKFIDGLLHGYPAPIVDHSTERDESLKRLAEIKN